MKDGLPLQHVLIPTDFSETEHNALNYAIRLSQMSQAQLSLIHDAKIPILYEDTAASKLHALVSAEVVSIVPAFKAYVQQLKQEYPLETLQEIDLEYLMKGDNCIEQILNLTQLRSFSLLVLPTKNQNAFFGLFRENENDALLDQAKCPILAIPEKTHYRKIKNIYFATDLKGEESLLAIKKLRTLSEAINAELHFLHVITEITRSYEKKALDYQTKAAEILEIPAINWIELQEMDVLEAILSFCKKPEVDLLVVVKRPKSTFNKIITKQIPKYLAKAASIPILIL